MRRCEQKLITTSRSSFPSCYSPLLVCCRWSEWHSLHCCMLSCHSSSSSASLCRHHSSSSRWPNSHRLARAAPPVAAAAAAQPPAAPPPPTEQQQPESSSLQEHARPQIVVRGAGRVLRALCHYSPQDLSDGPASLSKVRPYNAAEVEAALQHATQQLHNLDLQQLSNIAGALAAAGHHNAAFMQQLGDAGAARLRAAPRLLQPADSLRAFRALCWLAVGFSRLGFVHPGLMEQVALYGTHLLQRSPLTFSKQKHGQQVAMLAGAFAALKLYPPQLLAALCEHIKLHKYITSLLGAEESMLLLWALARVGHEDPPVQLWVTQRAAAQVGQLTCEGLAHAYSQCAEVGLDSAPLLAALRKACRGKLMSMQPAELLALLTSLAALGQQDLLYLDEISRAVHNKLANFTAAQVSSSMAALAALRYSNPWLLERVSKILVSRRLRKAHQLTPHQLADILGSCQQLGYANPLLLGHLGAVAAEVQLQDCSPAKLAAVVSGFEQLRFHQPQLLQAAATRLLRLVLQLGALETTATAAAAGVAGSSPDSGQQQQQQCEVAELIAAALHLASMPSAAGNSAEKAVLPAAVLGLTAQVLSTCSRHQQDASSSSSSSQAGVGGLQDVLSLQVALLLLVNSRLPGTLGGPAAVREQPSQLSEVTGQLIALQHQVQVQVVQQLAAAAAACPDDAAGVQVLGALPQLLQCMQLVWLKQQAHTGVQMQWQLGMPEAVAAAFVRQQRELLLLQQQQGQQQSKRPGLQAVAAAVTRALQAASQQMQQQQQQQQEPEQQQQQQQPAVEVVHCIPGSPLVLPIAVLPASFGSVAADTRQQGVWLHVTARLQQRKLQLPAEAQELLSASLRHQRPVAVFVEAGSWFTRNEPQQLLPAGQLWHQGLLAAGWDVLVLEEAEDESATDDS